MSLFAEDQNKENRSSRFQGRRLDVVQIILVLWDYTVSHFRGLRGRSKHYITGHEQTQSNCQPK